MVVFYIKPANQIKMFKSICLMCHLLHILNFFKFSFLFSFIFCLRAFVCSLFFDLWKLINGISNIDTRRKDYRSSWKFEIKIFFKY